MACFWTWQPPPCYVHTIHPALIPQAPSISPKMGSRNMHASRLRLLILIAALGSLVVGFGVASLRTAAPPREDREAAEAGAREGPGRKATADTNADDWPAYKHDVARSGATTAGVPTA